MLNNLCYVTHLTLRYVALLPGQSPGKARLWSSASFVYIPTVDCDGAILTKLFFSFMNLTDEINEALSRLWDTLLWPISEMELANGARLTVLLNKPETQLALYVKQLAVKIPLPGLNCYITSLCTAELSLPLCQNCSSYI